MSRDVLLTLLPLAVMLMLAASGADGRKHGHKIVKRAPRNMRPAPTTTEATNGNEEDAKGGGDADADSGADGEEIGAGTEVRPGADTFRIKVGGATHEPPMTEEQEKEEVRDIDINVGLNTILALPDSKAPKLIKEGIKKLVKFSNPLQDLILKALGMVSTTVKPGIDLLISFVQNLLKLLAKSTLGIKREISASLKTVLNFLVNGKDTLSGLIASTIGKLSKVSQLMAQQVNAFANFLVGGLRQILRLIQNTLVFKFTITANVMMNIIKQLLGMITGGRGTLTDAMENVLETAEGRKLDFLGGLRSMISFATKGTNLIISHLVNLLGTVGAVLGPILNQILSAVFSVPKGLTLSG